MTKQVALFFSMVFVGLSFGILGPHGAIERVPAEQAKLVYGGASGIGGSGKATPAEAHIYVPTIAPFSWCGSPYPGQCSFQDKYFTTVQSPPYGNSTPTHASCGDETQVCYHYPIPPLGSCNN